jgi:hypothetical protein
MEHCYCYNFTKPSYGAKIRYQSRKLFRVKVEDFVNFDDLCIRSVIDYRSSEFNLMNKGFDEKCKDVETDKAWFKLMHLLFGFLGKYDVKGKIADDIKGHLRSCSDYYETAKSALSSYIELLRTGEYYIFKHEEYYVEMSVNDLVDLLEEELLLRTTIYQDPKSKKVVIVEITDYYYDYDALYKKYGIVDPEDTSSESYNEFINYITTSEETGHLKDKQDMYAQMYGE